MCASSLIESKYIYFNVIDLTQIKAYKLLFVFLDIIELIFFN